MGWMSWPLWIRSPRSGCPGAVFDSPLLGFRGHETKPQMSDRDCSGPWQAWPKWSGDHSRVPVAQVSCCSWPPAAALAPAPVRRRRAIVLVTVGDTLAPTGWAVTAAATQRRPDPRSPGAGGRPGPRGHGRSPAHPTLPRLDAHRPPPLAQHHPATSRLPSPWPVPPWLQSSGAMASAPAPSCPAVVLSAVGASIEAST